MTVLFMSDEHVVAMNELIARSEAVRRACASRPRSRSMAYRLHDGPGGETVHWHAAVGSTIRFSLTEQPADVVLVGQWSDAIRAARAARDGVAADAGLVVEGDAAALIDIAPVLEIARAVATVPVNFPEI